jgi:YbbR domain-containing protein
MIALLRKLVVEDFPLKLFSLAMAIMIYCTVFFAIKNETPELGSLALAVDFRTFYNVPVLIVSSAADVRRLKVAPETVAVTVQGDPRILARLENGDIRALVDLTRIESATDLRARIDVSTPPGVIRFRIVPSEVRIIFPKDH